MRNSFRGNYVTTSDCRMYSTLEPNRNRLGELIVCPAQKIRLSSLHIRVILEMDWRFLISVECSLHFWMDLFLQIVIVSIWESSHEFFKCREHGDFVLDRNDLRNCLTFPSKHRTLSKSLNNTFSRKSVKISHFRAFIQECFKIKNQL